MNLGDGIGRHPVEIYESGAMAAFLVVYLHALRGGRTWAVRHGFHALVLAYAVQRFAWEWLKPYPPVVGPLRARCHVPAGAGCRAQSRFDPKAHRTILTEIRREVARSGVFGLDDLIPLPCNPDQICIGYGLRRGQEVTPITSLLPRELILQGPNTISYEAYPALREAVNHLLSLSTAQCNTEEKLAGVLCCLPEAFVPERLSYADSFRIVTLHFLDRYNFDLGTVKRSCVHFLTPDGQIIPFDTYSSFYRPGAEGAGVLARALA